MATFDPSKPLKDAQHELFAQALARGETQRQAYVTAGYEQHDGNASRLSNNERVSQRVEWLKAKAAKKTVLTREKWLNKLHAIAEDAHDQADFSAATGALREVGKASAWYEPEKVEAKLEIIIKGV